MYRFRFPAKAPLHGNIVARIKSSHFPLQPKRCRGTPTGGLGRPEELFDDAHLLVIGGLANITLPDGACADSRRPWANTPQSCCLNSDTVAANWRRCTPVTRSHKKQSIVRKAV